MVRDALLALRPDPHMFHQVLARGALDDRGLPCGLVGWAAWGRGGKAPALRCCSLVHPNPHPHTNHPSPQHKPPLTPTQTNPHPHPNHPEPPQTDPTPFFQANLRVLGSGGGGSLAMMWSEAVLSLLTSYVDWPVRSLGLDDLAQLYLERQQRDECRLTYRLTVGAGGTASAGGLRGVAVSSGAAPGGGGSACVAPLVVRTAVELESARAGGGRASVATADGVRTLTVRVPANGAVSMRVVGAAAPWLAPRQ